MPETAVPDEAWSPDASGPRTANPPSYVELAGYTDFTPVAAGGESTVYRALQVGLDRPVAVKILAAGPDGGEDRSARFQRELEITVRLGRAHPHIVSVLDTRVLPDGRPCIVMEYFDAGSLYDQLRARGPLPVAEVIAIGVVISDALAFAHAQGVLHRDVKPQNILVLPTSYVLADFGLARRADAGHSASMELFSYRHAAPQVLDGELPDAADDVYSLGSTLFTLLDGRPPFAADDPDSDNPLAYIRRVRTAPPREISIRGVPDGLAAIIRRCLAKRREERFPDATKLHAALSALGTEDRAWAPDAAPTGSKPAVPPTEVAPAVVAKAAVVPPNEAAPTVVAKAAVVPPTGPSPQQPAPSEPTMPVESLGRSMWSIESSPEVLWVDRSSNAVLAGVRPEAPAETPAAPPEPRRRSGWPRLVILLGIAVLLGVLATVTIVWVSGLNTVALPGPSATPATDDPGRPVPSFSGALSPENSGPARVDDPAIAPQITRLTDRGTSFEVTWSDRSGGKAVFVIVEIVGTEGVPLTQVGAGKTSAIVDGIEPGRPYCLAVLAVTEASQGISPLKCTGVRGSRPAR
ncbi:serine/threonine-protein kinase [Allorhizocola rhizosphaerae]|uniref:serine/threonine-protein kinase n=1 Tax=Allorhizocola rhizosphaerae TaxID=1872709 RepID=UPI0013C2E4BE|nr:serine/threonine-protein kinase [Allorhizocola rhizosphaerae]